MFRIHHLTHHLASPSSHRRQYLHEEVINGDGIVYDVDCCIYGVVVAIKPLRM